MLREIEIDHKNPTWVRVWNSTTDKEKRIYLYTFQGQHICVSLGSQGIFLKGKKLEHNFDTASWQNIEFIKTKKRLRIKA